MVKRFLLIAFVLAALTAWAADNSKFFPLKDLKPGMKGVGKTVFSGSHIEEFQVEILGVLTNVGPKQSIILGRLSGGPLEKTGVMAGMSGSPVYIGGKLAGAVALSFPFSKEPIAGITPIEQMAGVLERAAGAETPSTVKVQLRNVPTDSGTEPRVVYTANDLAPKLPEQSVALGPDQPRLARIATPLVLSGFTSNTLEQFAPQLRSLGLMPMQGGGGGSPAGNAAMGDASALQPGSMISVQLIRGDFGANADGTVTYREGDRIYAFGHRFLAAGPVEMPFAASQVVTLLPNQANSFKISVPGQPLGVIRQDRSPGILGALGEKARMIPVGISVKPARSKGVDYRFEMINHPVLTPFLLQMVVFGTLDATERVLGESSLAVAGTVRVKDLPPVRIENMFSSNLNAGMMAAQNSAAPLALLMQSGFSAVEVEGVDLQIVTSDERRIASLDRVWSSKREVRPGERIEVAAVLRGDDGAEMVKRAGVEIPGGIGPGPLQITVADGTTLNMAEMREMAGGFAPATPSQLVRAINNLRKNNRLYVRLTRPQPAFVLHGVQFPAPPPSLAQTMSHDASVSNSISTVQASTLGEVELEPVQAMVAGQKTITLTVKD